MIEYYMGVILDRLPSFPDVVDFVFLAAKIGLLLFVGAAIKICVDMDKARKQDPSAQADWSEVLRSLRDSMALGLIGVVLVYETGYLKPDSLFGVCGVSLICGFLGAEIDAWLFSRMGIKDVPEEGLVKMPGCINDRQRRAISHVSVYKSITNAEYCRMNGVSAATATRELSSLVGRGLLLRVGALKGTKYTS